jgi:hypothetical protein
MNKKGAISWEYMVAGILVLVVLITILVIFTEGARKGGNELIDKLEGTGDEDKDGVPNLLDKCPCDSDVGLDYTSAKKTKNACKQCP